MRLRQLVDLQLRLCQFPCTSIGFLLSSLPPVLLAIVRFLSAVGAIMVRWCVRACVLASHKACGEQPHAACVEACSAMACLDAWGAVVGAVLQHCYYFTSTC